MYLLNQAENIGSHHKEIASSSRSWVPVGMGRETRDQHSRSGPNLHFGISRLDVQGSFEDIPGFIVALMNM